MKRPYVSCGGPKRRRELSPSMALVFRHYGGAMPVAAVLKVTRQAVNKWSALPAEHALKIEADTKGALRAYQLAPKIYPRWLVTWPRPARGKARGEAPA